MLGQRLSGAIGEHRQANEDKISLVPGEGFGCGIRERGQAVEAKSILTPCQYFRGFIRDFLGFVKGRKPKAALVFDKLLCDLLVNNFRFFHSGLFSICWVGFLELQADPVVFF
ncbi:hypothetical protein OAH29_00190 [Akkermansiaceae bacterium]|nr:hypothetical protein [Akkermansiaceae bacterium]